jgi:hypothetical protein
VINTYSRSAAKITAPFLAFAMSKSQNLLYETAIMTESLASSMTVLFFALLFLVLKNYSRRNAIILSLITASMVLLKPGAFPFFLIIIIAGVYIAFKKKELKYLFTLLIPFTLILVCMGLYNKFEYGNFSNTNSGSENLALVTNIMWEPKNEYPLEINQAILESQVLVGQRISPEDLDLLITSWDFEQIYPLYLAGHFYGPSYEIGEITDGYGGSEWDYWITRISIDTIKKYPVYYFKHYLVMMQYNFRLPYYYNSQSTIADVLSRFRLYAFDEHFSASRDDISGFLKEHMVSLGKEYSNPLYKPGALRVDRENQEVTINKELKYLDHYEKYSSMYESSLNYKIWVVITFIFVIFSIVNYIRSRSFVYFFLVLAGISIIMNFSIVALVEYSLPRYTYIYEFLYLLIPIIFVTEKLKNLQNESY